MSLFNVLKRAFGRLDTQDESPSERQTKRRKTTRDDADSLKRRLGQSEGAVTKDKNSGRCASSSEHKSKRLKVVGDDRLEDTQQRDDRMEVDVERDDNRMRMDEDWDEENKETDEVDFVQPVGGSMIASGPRRVSIKDNMPWGWSIEELETGERQARLIRVLGARRP